MDGLDGWDGMGWDGSPGGPRYRAPTVLIKNLTHSVTDPVSE